MKKILFLFSVLAVGLMITFANVNASDKLMFTTNDTANAVLEEITGTWCGYCPCGHTIVSSILTTYPNTVVLLYHGPPNYGTPVDPWASVGYPMIQLFGASSYPTAVINRSTGIVSRSTWASYVASYTTTSAPVRIVLTNPTVNNVTRKITGTVTSTALTDLTGAYSIFVAITENNLVQAQNVYSACGSAGVNYSYVHNHVVRALVTPTTGTQITAGPWSNGTALTYALDYTVSDTSITLANTHVNFVVYKNTTPYTTSATVQNGISVATSSFVTTGVGKLETVSDQYNLSQNYPNPFNPTTNIKFSVPKDGNVSLKIYDISGKLVSNYFSDYFKAGTYTVVFDGSSLSSGVYFYKITSKDFSDVKRMMLVK
jgi:hypothetical protein